MTQAEATAQSVRLYNWNYAGAPVFLGFMVAPLMLGGFFYAAATGRIVGKEGPADAGTIIGLSFGVLILAGIMFYRACTSAVLWLEIGDELRCRKPFWTVHRKWDDVKELYIVSETGLRMPVLITPILTISRALTVHAVLLIVFRDETEVRVNVRPNQMALVEAIRSRQRMSLVAGAEG